MEEKSGYIHQRREAFRHGRKPVLICAGVLAIVYYLWSSTTLLEPQRLYAVCSPDGASKIYTIDEENTTAECFLVKGERFAEVGSIDGMRARVSDIRFIPEGAVVIPGMTDSHVHALYYGLLRQLPLGGTSSVAKTVAKVRAYVESEPDILHNKSAFIEGWGWDHTKWGSGKEWPTAAALDSDPVLRGRPIALRSHDAHAYWVSPRVLSAMDIPDKIDGGIIRRDENGNPTGVFMDNARELIPIPDPSEDVLLKRWQFVVDDCHSVGFTSVHDALLEPPTIEFFHNQAKKNNLALRVYGMKEFDINLTGYWGNTTKKIFGAGNDRFTLRSVKIVADGALRSKGAALYEPYADEPTNRGFFRVPPDILNEYIPKFIADGWQTNVHAIGDRTNGAVLDALDLVKDKAPQMRPRLEHAQIMKKEDAERVGKLGVIGSVQPSHVTSDMWYAEERLGDRINTLYPFHTIQSSGTFLTLGSDFPVEDMSPFYGIYSAVTRLSVDGTSPRGPEGYFPEEAISRLDALRGYTINPAKASFAESITGSIEVGKRADYVVLDRDILEVPIRDVVDTKVLATVMDGKVVYMV